MLCHYAYAAFSSARGFLIILFSFFAAATMPLYADADAALLIFAAVSPYAVYAFTFFFHADGC